MSFNNPVRVKICGITRAEDALIAVEVGADALGFIFYEESPRSITPSAARDIVAKLPPFIAKVGVFVNEEVSKVREIAAEVGLTTLQLHGEESPAYCEEVGLSVIKALRVRGEEDIHNISSLNVAALLLDTYKKGQIGGTGEVFDWALALKALGKSNRPIILSGGLTPDNVAEAVKRVRPYAVDVSSGVEKSPGIKDSGLVESFIRRAKFL